MPPDTPSAACADASMRALVGLGPVEHDPRRHVRTDEPLHVVQVAIDSGADAALAGSCGRVGVRSHAGVGAVAAPLALRRPTAPECPGYT
jgi:hypothetical protein